MNWFKQHVPRFVDCDRDAIPSIEFNTVDELLNIDTLVRFSKDKKFSHFCISDNYVMAVLDKGFSWWVVGYINDSNIDLPKWNGGLYKAKLNNGKVVTLNNTQVISSCGGTLTLRDGTTAKNLKYGSD